ncbi:MAG: hypothetical protein RMI01_10730, partial [Thermodesulfovibrio sp.]|nr:hypothetical protein [Thermodesulfovibrio sp.]
HLVEDRLGDLIFLRYSTQLTQAEPRQLEKLQFYNCEYSPEEGILVVKSPKGMLVHPEHGELILDEGKYNIYQVPYIQRGRGHD